MIESADNQYYSNRIIKSKSNLRYIYKIHEVIDPENNNNCTIPSNYAVIHDYRSATMEQRTLNRKQFDLELLIQELNDNPGDPRSLYYIAQTYGCMENYPAQAYHFHLRIDHPVEGYIQEKIDSLFELARLYNFKIDYVTKEPLTGPITPEQWLICEGLYSKAYSLDSTRPEALYFIGIHNYLLKDYPKAYDNFKKAFEIGYPVHSQYSLKPTLSFHYLPKFLTEVCYYIEDYHLGYSSAELFLKNNKQGSESWGLVCNWLNIHKQMKVTKVTIPQTNINIKVIAIVTDGGWEPWTGKDILTKGLGGSETWIIEMARSILAQGEYTPIVFCNTLTIELFEGISYNPVTKFHEFIAKQVVDHVIISRYTEYIPVALKGHSKNVHVIFHDILAPELIIPVHPKMGYLFGLTDWHTGTIKSTFSQFKTATLNYGLSHTKKLYLKEQNSFIYSSFPNRGLIILLRMWLRILEVLPDAMLNIYCNLDHVWVNQVAPEQLAEIKHLVNTLPGVVNHGWVSKMELTKAWQSAEYWLYPCIFEETFCMTALESASSKTFVISNNRAALAETIGDRGLIIHGDPWTQEWQNECIEKLKVSESFKNDCINRNYQWAKSLTWNGQAKKLIELLC